MNATGSPFFFNHLFGKKELRRCVQWLILFGGSSFTSSHMDKLKSLGFSYSTRSGISLGVDDLLVPTDKYKFITSSQEVKTMYQRSFDLGYTNKFRLFYEETESWKKTSEALKNRCIITFETKDILNPLYTMAFSGARGNISQVRQLVGMRGLMADAQGQIIPIPIINNFREGMTIAEYMVSCSGARKGIVDTAVRTARAGYLSRRLVEVAHGVSITEVNLIISSEDFCISKLKFSLSSQIIGKASVLKPSLVLSGNNSNRFR